MTQKNAISPTRVEDYPEWYQQVIKAADMAESFGGARLHGDQALGLWHLGKHPKTARRAHQRDRPSKCLLSLFIPLSYLEKEATHVEGFAKECAVVTHHRLEAERWKADPHR